MFRHNQVINLQRNSFMKSKLKSFEKLFKITILLFIFSCFLFIEIHANQKQVSENKDTVDVKQTQNEINSNKKSIKEVLEDKDALQDNKDDDDNIIKIDHKIDHKIDKKTEAQKLKDYNSVSAKNKTEAEKLQEKGIKEGKQNKELVPFGYSFFDTARKNVQRIEQNILYKKSAETSENETIPSESEKQNRTSFTQQNAISGFVGPMEMVSNSIYTTIPKRYILSPNDVIKLSFWGKLTEFKELVLAIDKHGFLTIPKGGKLVASGMTLYQLQENLKKLLRRTLDKNLEVLLTLERLKSIQITFTGEAYRPGSYAVSASTTLFNALYACGGISEIGSLRNIRLLRNQKTIHIDFYQYLLYGENHDDLPLQSGDNIFIPRSKRNISLKGEVNRPGLYEIKEGENLQKLLKIAGGIKSSGIYEKIQIESVSTNTKRIIIDVNLKSDLNKQMLDLHDGDIVTVFPVSSAVQNVVFLEGAVERPGKYELKKEMSVSDLFSNINIPLGEVYLERADIIRLNKNGKTTVIHSFNLEKALSKDKKHDLQLVNHDKIIVYSKWDVDYIPPRKVSITGAVQNPKEFKRSDGMTIQDLLLLSGGLMPDVYHKRADLFRYDFKQKITTMIPINLSKILDGDPLENIKLKDNDFIRVYSKEEVSYTREHKVTIYGAVQRPDEYPRSKNLDLKTLLFMAGGLMPGHHNIVEVVHAGNNRHRITQKDIDRLIQGDESQNLKLKDEDIVMIKMRSAFLDRPLLVNITGQVKYPGIYALNSRYDKINDIIERAGGFTRLAYEKGAVFKRKRNYIPSEEIRQDLAYINQTVKEMNIYEYRRQKARNDYLWTTETGEKVTSPVTDISSAAVIQSDASDESIAKSLLAPGIAGSAGDVAGGAMDAFRALPSVISQARILGVKELIPSERIIVDIQKAVANPEEADNLILQNEDSLFIPQMPSTVSVIGAVMRPTVIAHGKNGIASNNDVRDYINLAGGYQTDADIEKTIVFRVDGSIIPVDNLQVIEIGDVVYVPNKPISMEIVTTTDKILDTIKYAVVTLTGYMALIAILAL